MPEITTFYVELEDCPKSRDGTVKLAVDWTTERATRVAISIDGQTVPDTYPPDGSTIVSFDCAAESHAYTLVAYSVDGVRSEPKTPTVPRKLA